MADGSESKAEDGMLGSQESDPEAPQKQPPDAPSPVTDTDASTTPRTAPQRQPPDAPSLVTDTDASSAFVPSDLSSDGWLHRLWTAENSPFS